MEVKDYVMPGYKKWECQNGRTYCAKENSCLFCAHCTDIFWDYTNGPYMFICERDQDIENGFEGKCKYFMEKR